MKWEIQLDLRRKVCYEGFHLLINCAYVQFFYFMISLSSNDTNLNGGFKMNDNGSKNTESEIKFYEFGSEEKRQEKLNEALKSVMDKDFLAFNERLDKINKEIKRFLDEKSIPFGSLGNDVSKIDEI